MPDGSCDVSDIPSCRYAALYGREQEAAPGATVAGAAGAVW